VGEATAIDWLTYVKAIPGLVHAGRAVQRWLGRPQLEIIFDASRTYGRAPIANIPGNPVGLFGHFVVLNHGRQVAKRCRSRLMALSRVEGEGEVPLPAFSAPRTLKWANEPQDAPLQDIDPGRPGRRSDLCFTIQGSDLLFFFVLEDAASGVQTRFPRGRYRATIRVEAEDGAADEGRLEINFDGTWEGLSISKVP